MEVCSPGSGIRNVPFYTEGQLVCYLKNREDITLSFAQHTLESLIVYRYDDQHVCIAASRAHQPADLLHPASIILQP
jgi:hypothetical protein